MAAMSDIEGQVDDLCRAFGSPLRRTVRLGSRALWEKRNRRAEVCMVIRRPNGNLLVFRKTFYPPGIYRLLTGGVEPEERVIDALYREVAEETSLHVEVARFLALVTYYAEDGTDECPASCTFAFLLDEMDGVLACADPNENLEAFGELRPEDLPVLVDQLEGLGTDYSPHFEEYWHEWGRYRAAAHRLVAQGLCDDTLPA